MHSQGKSGYDSGKCVVVSVQATNDGSRVQALCFQLEKLQYLGCG